MAVQNQYFPQSVPHPGFTLAEKLEEMGMGPKEFALRTGKPEKTIIAVLKGESSLTADMAIQFENVTKIPANFWLNYQIGYDEFIARERRKSVIAEAQAWASKFPLSELVSKGWLPQADSVTARTVELLSFFGFTNHTAWEDYYFKQHLKVRFRISLAKTHEPYAISAWLRQGELQAEPLVANRYSERAFREVLPTIKSVMSNGTEYPFPILQKLCLETGVKVVLTPCLSSAPISGSTHWLKETPLIQLNDSNNNTNSFWFTFFHEAGHILLHGKKDIFLEKVVYPDKDLLKEKEADEFAVRWMGNRES